MDAVIAQQILAELRAIRCPVQRQMTVGEVARVLRISPPTVKSYIEKGELKAAKLNRGTKGQSIYVVDPAAVKALLDANAATAPQRQRVKLPSLMI